MIISELHIIDNRTRAFGSCGTWECIRDVLLIVRALSLITRDVVLLQSEDPTGKSTMTSASISGSGGLGFSSWSSCGFSSDNSPRCV